MKRKLVLLLFLLFVLLKINFVFAKEVTVDDVVAYMNANNILDDQEYARLFGSMFNGKYEYDITKLSYTVSKEEESLKINVSLENQKEEEKEPAPEDQPTDKTEQQSEVIEKEFIFTIAEDSKISYTSEFNVDSLESRILTYLFNQLIYSVGGARGYNKEYLVEWMNQIDLNKSTIEEGLDCSFEPVFYTISKNGTDYEYEFSMIKQFTININTLTDQIPELIKAEINDVKASFTDISFTVNVKNHADDICNVYRRTDDNPKLVKVGQVRCNNETFIDKNVEGEKKYYYQASVAGIIMCSDEVEAQLEALPLTGSFISISSILVLIFIEIFIWVKYKKFNKVKKV